MAKSTQAQVASIIRKELKAHGIKAKVKSRSASMMTAVTVTVYNQLPCVVQKIESFCNDFEYGHFDGMTDCYEYSNHRNDIPQVKYLTVENMIDDEIVDAAWDIVRNHGSMEGKDRDDWESGQRIYRELKDSRSPAWASVKPRQRVQAA